MRIATRETLNLIYKPIPEFLLNNSDLHIIAKYIYAFLYQQFKNPITKVKQDALGEYIEVSREIIAKHIGICVKTVIKYLRSLCEYKYIKDVRRGINLVNKIYFYDVPSVYKIKEEPKVDSKDNGVMQNAKTLLKPLGTFSNKQVKNIVSKSRGDLEFLEKCVSYTQTRKPANPYPYLITVIEHNGYNSSNVKTTSDDSTEAACKEQVEECNLDKPKKKSNAVSERIRKYNEMEGHDWDFDLIGKLEQLHIEHKLGEISTEEYNRAVKQLNS